MSSGVGAASEVGSLSTASSMQAEAIWPARASVALWRRLAGSWRAREASGASALSMAAPGIGCGCLTMSARGQYRKRKDGRGARRHGGSGSRPNAAARKCRNAMHGMQPSQSIPSDLPARGALDKKMLHLGPGH